MARWLSDKFSTETLVNLMGRPEFVQTLRDGLANEQECRVRHASLLENVEAFLENERSTNENNNSNVRPLDSFRI
jgi:hypothetical protein